MTDDEKEIQEFGQFAESVGYEPYNLKGTLAEKAWLEKGRIDKDLINYLRRENTRIANLLRAIVDRELEIEKLETELKKVGMKG